MQRDESVTVDTDAQRVDGHTFESGYEIHDVAEAHIRQHIDDMGLYSEQWGINRREDKSVLGDDKLDLKVYNQPPSILDLDVGLCGLLEIKSKRNEDWFGIINRSHFATYLERTHEIGVPAYIYMCLVDDDKETILRDTLIPIQEWDEYADVKAGEFDYYGADEADKYLRENVERHPQVERAFQAPDGSIVIQLDVDSGINRMEWTKRMHNQTPIDDPTNITDVFSEKSGVEKLENDLLALADDWTDTANPSKQECGKLVLSVLDDCDEVDYSLVE